MADKEKKKRITGNVIRTVIFLCIIAISFGVCVHCFKFKDAERSQTTLEQFYALEDNTVDCIFFGSSATQRAFVVPEAYHEDGLVSYSFTCGTQPFMLTRYLMEETLKTQDPKLFVIELRGACKAPEDLAEVALRRMLDNMPMSKTKLDAIKAVLEYSEGADNGVDETGASYYFPFLKYHGLWNPSKQPKDLELDYYEGYALDPGLSFKLEEIYPLDFTDKQLHTAQKTQDALRDLLDYCDTLDAKVLFVASPYEASMEGMQKINFSQSVCESRGYEVLNYLPAEIREDLGLDDRTCYYNREHLNFYGSLKFTHQLTDHIMDAYDLPDRRGDPSVAAWEKEYQRLQSNLEGEYAKKYNKMMKKVNKIESGVQ